MLAILYITSLVASFLVPIFKNREEEKNLLTSAMIAILSGILYGIPSFNEIVQNIFTPNWKTIFGLLSLVFWNFAFLSNDGANWLNYMIAAFLGSTVIYFLCSNIYFSDYLVHCNENHDYTKRVSIITTIDGTESGESIYGEGFTIGLIVKQNPITRIYQYYYRAEDGRIKPKEIYESRVEITYIDADADPYVEIYYSMDCAGYRNNSKTHVFRNSAGIYHFYIPEGSIANISSESN